MVLPAPVADPVAAEGAVDWRERLVGLAELVEAGLLVLCEADDESGLPALVRAFHARGSVAHVITAPSELSHVPTGAVVVVCPTAEDGPQLNLLRPMFAHRALRAFVWATPETAGALREGAPDFFDWISHYQRCPTVAPPFVAAALRAGREGPGFLWRGGVEALRDAIVAVEPSAQVVVLSASLRYEEKLERLRASAEAWVLWSAAESLFAAQEIRWALAEVGRVGRCALVGAHVQSPGWWELGATRTSLREAAAGLREASVAEGGRLACVLELEPDTVALAGALVRRGGSGVDISAAALAADDPGAAVARLAAAAGVERWEDARVWLARPLFLRGQLEGLSPGPVLVGDEVDAEALGFRVARQLPVELGSRWLFPFADGWWIESQLRERAQRFEDNFHGAMTAYLLGHRWVALEWVTRYLRPKLARCLAAESVEPPAGNPFDHWLVDLLEGSDLLFEVIQDVCDQGRLTHEVVRERLRRRAAENEWDPLLDPHVLLDEGRGRPQLLRGPEIEQIRARRSPLAAAFEKVRAWAASSDYVTWLLERDSSVQKIIGHIGEFVDEDESQVDYYAREFGAESDHALHARLEDVDAALEAGDAGAALALLDEVERLYVRRAAWSPTIESSLIDGAARARALQEAPGEPARTYRDGLARIAERYGEDHPTLIGLLRRLAEADAPGLAVSHLHRALQIADTVYGPRSESSGEVALALARVHAREGDGDALRRVLGAARTIHAETPIAVRAQVLLGEHLFAVGEVPAAEAELRAAIELAAGLEDHGRFEVYVEAVAALGRQFETRGALERARELYREAVDFLEGSWGGYWAQELRERLESLSGA